MLEILSAISIFLLLLLIVSIYFNYKHAIIILDIQDRVETSLDILDERYQSISKILEKPVFFDSLEIRQVIRDLYESRDSLLYVAGELASIDKDNNVEISMTLTNPNCPVAGKMPENVGKSVEILKGLRSVKVNLVWEPKWDKKLMSEDAKLTLDIF